MTMQNFAWCAKFCKQAFSFSTDITCAEEKERRTAAQLADR